MAKVMLQMSQTHQEYEIDTDKQWFDFHANDIITYIGGMDGIWKNRRVLVKGVVINGSTEDLAGIIEGETYFSWSARPHSSQDLILLSRPAWPFKVGDQVIWEGQIGTVIVLDPRGEISDHNFLVEFHDWPGGSNGNQFDEWDKPWYPTQHKTESSSRLWCSSNSLILAPPEGTSPTQPDNATAPENRFINGGPEFSDVIIDTQGERFGFKNGDHIRIPSDGSGHFDYTVYGTKNDEFRRLLVTPQENPSLNDLYFVGQLIGTPPPNSVILLERPGLKFKVGDEVRIRRNEVGTIIAINPNHDQLYRPYLVNFPGSTSGNNANPFWHEYWYPEQHKTPSTSRIWLEESDLAFLSEPTSNHPTTEPTNTTTETSAVAQKNQPVPIMLNARILWREFKTRTANGALPVFDPLKITRENGLIIDCGEPETARNMEICLYKLGATIFHLLYDESEFNDEKYDAEPEATYGATLQKDEITDELIRFLLFGKPRSLEEVETRFELQLDEGQPPAAIPEVLPAEPETSLSANNTFERALATLRAQGLDAALAEKIVADPSLALYMIQFAKSKP